MAASAVRGSCYIIYWLDIAIMMYGSGYEGAAVLLPGFAINW